MKPFGTLKRTMILAGLGAALAYSPACKAQEVSPDHFTDAGVQDVYESAASKAAAPKPKQNQSAAQARSSQTNAPAALRPVAKRTPVSATQPGAQAVADKKRRSASSGTPKKP
jgi:hypothetical protein